MQKNSVDGNSVDFKVHPEDICNNVRHSITDLHGLIAATEDAIAYCKSESRDTSLDNVTAFKREPLEAFNHFSLSLEEISAMKQARFLVPDLVISGQVTVIASKPGCGKTSLLMDACADIVREGYNVLYVNMDCGAADIGYWAELARDGGFKLATPQFNGSTGIEHFLTLLANLLDSEHELSETVIVIDTLKKITDMMNKSRAKASMSLLRALSARGVTVICAAHCNKHLNDGALVFEGVGDIEADCDNLIYLESGERDQVGNKIITSVPSDKVRGIFSKRSWRLGRDRSVTALDSAVDVAAEVAAQSALERDEFAIEVIKEGIAKGNHKRIDLQSFALDNDCNRREFGRVLKAYCMGNTGAKIAPLWRNERQKKDNASYYVLIE